MHNALPSYNRRNQETSLANQRANRSYFQRQLNHNAASTL